MPDLLKLPHRLDDETHSCRAIIETPRGHRSKFDYDPASGLFELAGVLPAGMAFPLSFGFIPGTKAEDGDPVDILVLADEDLPVGCLVTVRLLGVVEAEQTDYGETCRNDRLIGKVAKSHTYRDVESLTTLGTAFTDDLGLFFQTYNRLHDRNFAVTAIGDAPRAAELIRQAAI
ncbi:inorganic diphosphatase [Sphingomonas beigongshangi]|uniref:inorganic diphosphatase n=1 Tax=Sphingomonas beigongshangi TaxID=2782540 RepID=UPI001AEE1B9B|nr:inorganic diphosphatase [Sphingomonas beigongshangi]